MKQPVLQVTQLTKQYKNYTAVNDISFSVKEGEVVGFLGPNGAGKTTTIQMLLGITQPTAGSIAYFGKEFFENKQYCLQRINYASAFNTLQGRMSVWENLLVFAYLYSIDEPKKKIMELIAYFQSEELLPKRYWDLSAGQRTRVNIMKSFLNDPKLILMDEPTASLDPDVADKTLTLLEELKKKQHISLLFTSHDMEEITRLCDRVIFLSNGKIVAEDSPLNLTKRLGHATLRLTFEGEKKDMENYLEKKQLTFSFHNPYLVDIKTEETKIPDIIFGITKTSLRITDIEVLKPTLEDFFLGIARGDSQIHAQLLDTNHAERKEH